jgi:hypothetical protein
VRAEPAPSRRIRIAPVRAEPAPSRTTDASFRAGRRFNGCAGLPFPYLRWSGASEIGIGAAETAAPPSFAAYILSMQRLTNPVGLTVARPCPR